MQGLNHRTKIVATIGPASSSPEVLRAMVTSGMSVARLNFSHGSYADHARMVTLIRQVSKDLATPITLLQDLQGPKIRIGQLVNDPIFLQEGDLLTFIPDTVELSSQNNPSAQTVTIDYPYLADDAKPGMRVLLDDGLLELEVHCVEVPHVTCRVLQGGLLSSRKGVNLPSLDLRMPSLTEKDQQDLVFGVAQGVDWVSLSFVRKAEDLVQLRQFLAEQGAADLPIMAKIEKPQAITNLPEILEVCDGVMVARGDLGVEMSPEKVPILQKHIIRECNKRKLPVITATQMLDSMIRNPRPTRAEASDVANAIIDGTDAVMLSGESAVGAFPVKAVQMLSRIAIDVERDLAFVNNPPPKQDETHALCEALNTLDRLLRFQCIVAFTTSGYTAIIAAGERPRAPVIAITDDRNVYHRLNLIWGVKPILVERHASTFEKMLHQAEVLLLQDQLAASGDNILLMGGIPAHTSRGTNLLKIHRLP
ncbi:pyruvate kinase [Synechococcales cyanobacterium C]|uniref:Pyruvate kinase n=1 Tax=Petrachloros mirabilis ULC683 TaxID=2781853 RepID=A0A8K2A923_9CYAN|nr:pyruvate kinase [Petrachloros mirabilis]NCJ07794.1 pyruvate kinase [Petrachloros mirabilis ULC683]